MKNNKGYTLFITIIILILLSFVCLGSMLLISNNVKVINKKVNYVYKELIITNSLFDVLNELLEEDEIEIKKYFYDTYEVNVINIEDKIYYIELCDSITKLDANVEIDFVNKKYTLLTLEVTING